MKKDKSAECKFRDFRTLLLLATSIYLIVLQCHVGAAQTSVEGTDYKKDQRVCLNIGDKVNLAIFEQLELAEDKWGGSSRTPQPDLFRSFIQRPELSGERTIQENEQIALPFLGQIRAASLTTAELELAVAKAFGAMFHRPAFVTVLSVEHNPIYVLGLVRNAGSYKYSAGMTVLHAFALAGGVERRPTELWQGLEAAREESRTAQLRASASRLLARQAVLRAERDAVEPAVPPQLARLLGHADAQVLVNDEAASRRLTLATRNVTERSLRAAVETSKSELELAKDRLVPLDANIKLRKERLTALTTLSSSGAASKAQLVEVQSSLFDVEGRRSESLAAIAVAKRRLEQAESELMRFDIENKNQLQLDIAAADRQNLDDLTMIEHSRETLKAFQIDGVNASPARKADSLVFEVFRRSGGATQIIQAQETFELEPGDLVRVRETPPYELTLSSSERE